MTDAKPFCETEKARVAKALRDAAEARKAAQQARGIELMRNTRPVHRMVVR